MNHFVYSLIPYHRRNPLAIAKLLVRDLYYWFYAKAFRRNIVLPKTLDRVLLVNPAHLGDVVISTAILRDLKLKLPNCSVDFLVGDWAAPVVKDHPGITQSFYISHWRSNRSDDAPLKKIQHYQQQVNRVMSELKRGTYSAIFFLNSYEPSFISLFKSFRCPLIGLVSAGGGPLLGLTGDSSAIHEVQIQGSLFKPWFGEVKNTDQYQSWLKGPKALDVLKAELGLNKPYVVIHPGSGNPAKEWPIGNWSKVISALDQYELDIVITGHGEREAIQAASLANNQTINLVGRLNFDQFTGVVAGAEAVFCVDSVAGHIAGAYDKSAIVIGNGLSNIERWRPMGKRTHLLVKNMPCSPCHSHPCAQRTCITSITPKILIDLLPEIFSQS